MLLITAMFVTSTTAFGPGATRTWVSGVGDDANPCSRTAPCKTFAGAISKTAAGGEINVLDPGGFGAVTITKAITISAEGVEGGALTVGGNGILINNTGPTAATDVVTLRGLDIEGGTASPTGVKFLAGGPLHIQNCTIRGFTSAADPNPAGIKVVNTTGVAKIDVTDTLIQESGNGTTGGGIFIQPNGAGAGASVTLTRVHVMNNTAGVKAVGTGNTGGLNVAINNSVVQGSSREGITAVATAGGSNVQINVDGATIVRNSVAGVNADGAAATVRIGRSMITGGAVGYRSINSGVIESYQTNQNRGNSVDGTATNIPQN
jgi:hypothetical protein